MFASQMRGRGSTQLGMLVANLSYWAAGPLERLISFTGPVVLYSREAISKTGYCKILDAGQSHKLDNSVITL
jgi:hypothetical protein